MHIRYLSFVVSTFCILELAKSSAGKNDAVFIIYGSPGGSTRNNTVGLYGGKFKIGDPANSMDLEQVDIHSAEYGDEYWNWIAPLYLSYDPISKDALMVYGHNRTLSMSRLDPCKQGNLITDQSMYFFGLKELHTGPFTLYNSEIYFIAQDLTIQNNRTVIKTLTIRKLVGCNDIKNTFVKSDGYDDRYCSVEVAKVLEGVNFTHYEELNSDYSQFLINTFPIIGNSLLIFENGNDLDFLVQIAVPLRGLPGNYTMDLYEVKKGRGAKLLHSQIINQEWSGYGIANIGEITYKDGLLCWTAYDNILCAKWQPGQSIGKVHQIIAPGDVSGVCNISGDFAVYENITTGIAIISASEPIHLVFGCWSDWTDAGGAGLVTIKNKWTDIEIKPISDRKGKIIASTIEIIDACPDTASSARRNTIPFLIAFSLVLLYAFIVFGGF